MSGCSLRAAGCALSYRARSYFFFFLFVCALLIPHRQVFKNYRLKSAEGLSLLFLVIWFLGDFSNLGGCLLGNLLSETPVCLSTQTIQAIYFLLIDGILCSQWIWYTKIRAQPSKEDQDPLIADEIAGASLELTALPPSSTLGETSEQSLPVDPKPAVSLLMIVPLLVFSIFTFGSHSSTALAWSGTPTQRRLLEDTSAEQTAAVVFSQIVAWVSTVMYLSCRIPQIVRNVCFPFLVV